MSEYKENLTKLAKGGSISAIGNSFNVLTRMLAGIFIAHLFRNPVAFGLYSLAYRIAFFLRIFAVPGTSEGIRRFMPIYRADKNKPAEKGLLFYALKMTAVLTVIIVVLLLIFAPAITRFFGKPEAAYFTRVLTISIPFFAFMVLAGSSLTGIHRVKYQVVSEKMVVPGSRVVIFFAFLFVGSQTLRNNAVIWCFPIGLFLGCAVAMYFFVKHFKVLRNRDVKPEYHVRSFLKFSLPLAASRPIAYLMNYVGTFIIAYYLTGWDIAQYEVVTRLAPLVIVPLHSAIIAFVPMISELHHLGKMDELARHFKFISKWIFTFSIFIFIAFMLLSKPILSVFGLEYSGILTQKTLVIVALAQLFNAAVGPVAMLISMTGRPRINMYNTIIMLFINTLLALVLVPMKGPFGGIVGAGIGQTIAIVGINLLFLLQVWHYLRMHPFSIGYFKPVVAGVLSGGIVYGILRFAGVYGSWKVFEPAGVVGYLWIVSNILFFTGVLAVFFSVFIYLLGLDDTDRFILGKLFSKIKGVKPKQLNDG